MVAANSPLELESYRQDILSRRTPPRPCIAVSSKATCCHIKGGADLAKAFAEERKALRLQKRIDIRTTGCLGYCQLEPIVLVEPTGVFYPSVQPAQAARILKSALTGEIVWDLLYLDPNSNERIAYEKDVPFYRKQKRLILENNALIDPTALEDYLAIGGYRAAGKTLFNLSPEEVIEEIKRSSLAGRGGAGFGTGAKWEMARREKSAVKYVICNADEGDPGAYMDRSILESNPHSVIEGMLIGAYAIGAGEGWIYVRDEYPLAVRHIALAIEQAKELGLLGRNILGSDFGFTIRIAKGAGAFVCGEETALIASIEGKRGVPRQRPPFPAQNGLFGKPTNINNVETWANVPVVMEKGADLFSRIGTEKSKGTKIFSLVGKVQNTGLVEVSIGTTLREVVFEIGGGAPNGKKVKAVQIGGPSGGCIPCQLFDLPIDYESLASAGAIMGSGGMIVIDDDTCMVDMARYFTHFLQEESCGKCVTCREGLQRMHEILVKITKGYGKAGDPALLEELAGVVKNGSLCGLGQTAANPVLSILRYYGDEFKAHIDEKECPAGVCTALVGYEVDADKCTGCGLCKAGCPRHALEGKPGKAHRIEQTNCTSCGICHDICKFGAIFRTSRRRQNGPSKD